MRHVCLWMLAGVMLLLADCVTEDVVGRGVQDVSSTVSDIPSRRMYVSLSAHEVIGSSSLGDTHENALWMPHTNWDIAFCNGMIRTNSGSSGEEKGGTMRTPVSHDDVDNPRASSYQTDARQTVTVKSAEVE